MKSKNYHMIIAFVFMGLIIYSGVTFYSQINSSSDEYMMLNLSLPNSAIISDFIDIDGDTSLGAFQPKTGNGTLADPYIIKDLEIKINASTSTQTAIFLGGVTKYVILQNLTLTGWFGTDEDHIGIHISNSEHIIIRSCRVSNFYDGIFIDNSKNVNVTDSLISNCYDSGIFPWYAENVTISNNIIKNSTSIGLSIQGCNMSIKENDISGTNVGCGISLDLSDNITIDNNLITNNKESGIEISTSVNCITVRDNQLVFNNRSGISSYSGNNLTIIGNNISHNLNSGILMNSGENMTIHHNLIQNNEYYGISMELTNKTWVNLNSFIGNKLDQAISNFSIDNNWDNGTLGNYWGDYTTRYPAATNNAIVWNTAYVLASGGQDNKPLVRNPLEVGFLEVEFYYQGGLVKILPPVIQDVLLNTTFILTNQTSGNWTISNLYYGSYNLSCLINSTQYSMIIQITEKMNYIVIVLSVAAPGAESTNPDNLPPPSPNSNPWGYYVVFGVLGVVIIFGALKFSKVKKNNQNIPK